MMDWYRDGSGWMNGGGFFSGFFRNINCQPGGVCGSLEFWSKIVPDFKLSL